MKVSPAQVTSGCTDFFEPDFFVEAKPGLATKAGVKSSDRSMRSRILSLAEILDDGNHRDWSDLAVGLNAVEAFGDVYKRERQFSSREPKLAVILPEERASLAAKAMIGAFPLEDRVQYIGEDYKRVFSPTTASFHPGIWKSVYRDQVITPIRATIHELDISRYWFHDPRIFAFDQNSTHDIIDLWNLRLQGNPVIPVPIDWWDSLLPEIEEMISENYRPLPGNRHGVMLRTTIESSRSLTAAQREQLEASLPESGRAGVVIKHFRDPIWEEQPRIGPRLERLKVEADERRIELPVSKSADKLRTAFDTLAPPFAQKHGGTSARWVNVLSISDDYHDEVATCLPYNFKNSEWPRILSGIADCVITSEGWAITERFVNSRAYLDLLDHEHAIVGALNASGVVAKPSEPGRIAKQVLAHLNGLWGVSIIRDRDTIELLNKMAMGARTRGAAGETTEELFERRSKGLAEWSALVRRRSGRLGRISLEDFTRKSIIRLGIQTICPKLHVRKLDEPNNG